MIEKRTLNTYLRFALNSFQFVSLRCGEYTAVVGIVHAVPRNKSRPLVNGHLTGRFNMELEV